MGEKSNISWTDATFNPWWGCTEVSREEVGGGGCDNCYAREFAKRYGYPWGQGAPRRFFDDKHWNEPLKWNRKAKESGKRMKVFCASMADIFDNEVDQIHRERLWKLIEDTPWLDWQLLTKRIGNAKTMFPIKWVDDYLPKNIWMGITVVNQPEANRDISKLLEFNAAVHWLSLEPLLGPIKLIDIDHPYGEPSECWHDWISNLGEARLEWFVVGGESGARPREFQISWLERIVNDARAAGVPVWVKQDSGYKPGQRGRIPDSLWIQEFPL